VRFIAGIGRRTPERTHHPPRNGGCSSAHRRSARPTAPRAIPQVWNAEQIPVRAGLQRAEDQFVVVQHGKNDDGVAGNKSFSRDVHSMPDMRGRRMSIKMASGRASGIMCMASSADRQSADALESAE